MAGTMLLGYPAAGLILSELLPFTVEKKMPSISALVGFVIDCIAFFKDSKSNFNANLFYRA